MSMYPFQTFDEDKSRKDREPVEYSGLLPTLLKLASENKDKAVLVATSIVLIWMLLFPPFHLCVPTPSGAIYERNKGYGFILQPPHDELREGVKVNVQLLGLQCMIVCATGAMLWVVFKKK
jgi:hypothetical protein